MGKILFYDCSQKAVNFFMHIAEVKTLTFRGFSFTCFHIEKGICCETTHEHEKVHSRRNSCAFIALKFVTLEKKGFLARSKKNYQ